jgi:preprotein translocase subunit YajC
MEILIPLAMIGIVVFFVIRQQSRNWKLEDRLRKDRDPKPGPS